MLNKGHGVTLQAFFTAECADGMQWHIYAYYGIMPERMPSGVGIKPY
jgi:hypothetical protein